MERREGHACPPGGFFQIVQNKMHWAAHGHTAAEIIAERADAEKPNMGLTSWGGATPAQADVEVAKNYLSAEELDTLNRIVTMYERETLAIEHEIAEGPDKLLKESSHEKAIQTLQITP